MSKRLMQILIFLLTPLLIVVGFSSWIIVGEKSETVGKLPSTSNVCYINSDTTGNQYTRIEKALEVASEGDIVYVKPGLKNTDNTTSREIRIYRDCTIKSGVTLSLPYVTSSGTLDHYEETVWGNTQVFADKDSTSVNKYRNTLVVLSEGVTLTVSSGAKLEIGGVFGVQSNPISGIVNGSYCEIAMEENSSIISYGIVDCYGMIKEYDYLNNGSKLEIKRGTINLPFAIYDFKGGTKSLELSYLSSPKIAPFNQFDISNIQTILRIHSGVSAIAEYRLYMNDTQIRGKCNFIGSSSTNTLFILTSGYMDLKYTPETIGYTSLTQIIGQTIFSLYGNVTFGSIFIDIKVYISATLDTSDYHMPISYKFKLIVEDGATLIIPNKIKFLQGAKAYIEKGGTVQISNEVFGFESYADTSSMETNGLNVSYPISLPKSQIINNGYLMIDEDGKLAMNVESSASSAILDVSSSSNSISFTLKGENYTDTANMYLNGTLDGNSSPSELSTNVYVSQSNYKWQAFTGSYSLSYNKTYTNESDEFESSVSFTGHNESTTAVTLTGDNKTKELTSSYSDEGEYKFLGWYYDEMCTDRIIDNVVYGSRLIEYANSNNVVNVYAKFTKSPLIDIEYYGKVSTNSIDYNTLVDSTTRQTIAGETITLLSPLDSYYKTSDTQMDFYKFNGWNILLTYLDGSTLEYYANANSEFTIPKDYNGESIKIQAAEYSYDYSNYLLTISGTYEKIISSSGIVSISKSGWNSDVTVNNNTFWLEQGDEITVTLVQYRDGWSYEARICYITGAKFEGNLTEFASGDAWNSSSVSKSFVMPNNSVTLTTN